MDCHNVPRHYTHETHWFCRLSGVLSIIHVAAAISDIHLHLDHVELFDIFLPHVRSFHQ